MKNAISQYISLLLGVLLVGASLTGCTLADSRDVCCTKVILEYRYVRNNTDEYSTEVQQMRHFLFDAQGTLIRELPQGEVAPQVLSISGLPEGRYSVLTIGNATDALTHLMPTVKGSRLSDMTLSLKKQEGGVYAPQGDELFWNFQTIDVLPGRRSHYICDLANIHAHLYYTVVWQSAPRYADGYTVRLSGLSEAYSLNPAASDLHLPINPSMQVTHDFPLHRDRMIQTEGRPKLFNHTLEGHFISLRYRNNRIPTIQLWHGEEPLTRALDLTLAFESFGWIPDLRAEQIYRILIRINDDGSVTVFPYLDGSVADWVPGGTVVQ